jgi:hypothetical protein
MNATGKNTVLDERDDRAKHEQRIEERRVMDHTRIMTCKAGWPSPPAMAPGAIRDSGIDSDADLRDGIFARERQ